VQMTKSDPEPQSKSSLSDCTWLENEYGSFNLETMKFLMHFREQGSSLYFIFTHTHFFLFSFSHIYIYIYSVFLFIFLFLIFYFFICSPLNSKIALYLSPRPCLDVCSSSGKEVIEIR
jgi:hypothetical protein